MRGDRVLLLSKNVLLGYYYNQRHKKVPYDASDIRDLLANDGYYNFFSKGERANMLPDEECGYYVFLLSVEQLEKLNLSKEQLIARSTPMVSGEGDIILGEKEVNRPTDGVRPAIWVKKTAKK